MLAHHSRNDASAPVTLSMKVTRAALVSSSDCFASWNVPLVFRNSLLLLHWALLRRLQELPDHGDEDGLLAFGRAHAASPGAIQVALSYAESLAAAGRVEEARALGSRVAGWVLGEFRDRDVYAFLDSLPRTPNVAARD